MKSRIISTTLLLISIIVFVLYRICDRPACANRCNSAPKGYKSETRTEFIFKAKDDSYAKVFSSQKITHYDSLGRGLGEFIQDSRGNLMVHESLRYGRLEYIRDDQGKIVQKSTYGLNDSLLTRHIFTHDSLGRKITERTFMSGKPYSIEEEFSYNDCDKISIHKKNYSRYWPDEVTTNTYNDDCLKIENISARIDGSHRFHMKYYYHESGFLCWKSGEKTTEYLHENGDVRSLTVSEYNYRGEVIQSTEYDESGEIESFSRYTHDRQGNDIKSVRYGPSGEIQRRVEKTFAGCGKIQELTVYENEILQQRTLNQYNSEGNKSRRYEYEYELIDSTLIEIPVKYYEFSYEIN
ncbi:MAG: hypothetical protein H8D46_04610 [FCB group bacterium]|nr:hypothetical protein [FCB group bacterium]